MNRKRPEPKQAGWDFWMGVKSLATLSIFLPNGYLRLKPFIEDTVAFVRSYGWTSTVEEALPIYFRSFIELYGWHLTWSILLLILSMVYALVAAKALVILLTKLILRLGFRAEESGSNVLLHPEDEEG